MKGNYRGPKMKRITKALKKRLPNVYVHSLMIGNNEEEDTENTLLMSVDKQIEIACDKIGNDPCLQEKGYNAIGLSQGGQFLRAVAQKCPQGMKTLVSFGGQHQGKCINFEI